MYLTELMADRNNVLVASPRRFIDWHVTRLRGFLYYSFDPALCIVITGKSAFPARS